MDLNELRRDISNGVILNPREEKLVKHIHELYKLITQLQDKLDYVEYMSSGHANLLS